VRPDHPGVLLVLLPSPPHVGQVDQFLVGLEMDPITISSLIPHPDLTVIMQDLCKKEVDHDFVAVQRVPEKRPSKG
jgi:hypothetical protein